MRFLFSDYFLIVFLAIIAIVSIGALPTDWFARYWWLDNVLHLSGGIWLASVFLAVFGRRQELAKFSGFIKNPWLTIIFTISVTILVGVLWEFYEYIFDDGTMTLADTISDLQLDLLGGALVALAGALTFSKRGGS